MAQSNENLHWLFRRDIMGGWAWECFNDAELVVARCEHHFGAREECIEDESCVWAGAFAEGQGACYDDRPDPNRLT